MTIGIVLDETMSGHANIDGQQLAFRFSIRAYTPRIFSLSAPREFRGIAELGGVELPVTGTLTIRVTGPRYELDLDHPQLGALHIEGEKTYSANPAKLVASLTTCPLTVYRDGKPVGDAEVVYRDSMVAFAFKAVRLVSEEKAFGSYA